MNKYVRGAIGGVVGALIPPVFFGGFIYFAAGRDPLPIFAELAGSPVFLIIYVVIIGFGFAQGFGGPGGGRGGRGGRDSHFSQDASRDFGDGGGGGMGGGMGD